jgi:phospholipid-binding lipoprotein MlaA
MMVLLAGCAGPRPKEAAMASGESVLGAQFNPDAKLDGLGQQNNSGDHSAGSGGGGLGGGGSGGAAVGIGSVGAAVGIGSVGAGSASMSSGGALPKDGLGKDLAGQTLTGQAPDEPGDPFQSINRRAMHFNFFFDKTVLLPIHKMFSVLPEQVHTGFRNVISTIEQPVSMINSLLQGNPLGFFQHTGRLLINAVMGFGGLLDPATHMGLAPETASFGQTLQAWGVPSGPFVVTPFLGPSTLREAFGRVADCFLVPLTYVKGWNWGYTTATYVNTKVIYRRLEDDVISAFEDPYAAIRDTVINMQKEGTLESMAQEGNPDDPLWQLMHGAQDNKETAPVHSSKTIPKKSPSKTLNKAGKNPKQSAK